VDQKNVLNIGGAQTSKDLSICRRVPVPAGAAAPQPRQHQAQALPALRLG